MLYPICSSCGEYLGHKQLIYEKEIQMICDEMKLDYDTVSRGYIDDQETFSRKRSDIVNKLCRRWCCKQLMVTYLDVSRYIK